ncbi:MAG TPA: hypothetical protein ENK19_10300 [Acidobacteria bacterium]|nr:hypothetical protein [Acidobacteriota bacterium]
MRAGRGGAGLFFLVLNAALAVALWMWPYRDFAAGRTERARRGVLVASAVGALLVLLAMGSGQAFTALLGLAALASLLYLLYKLGNDSWNIRW